MLRNAVLLIGIGLCACAPSPAVEAEAVAELIAMAQDSMAESEAVPPGPGTSSEAALPTGMHFSVEPSIAAPRSVVSLVLRNETPYPIGYNLCDSGLEQLRDGIWHSVPHDGVCTRELRIAAPGHVARYQHRLPASIAAGHYRFRTRLERRPNSNSILDTIYTVRFAVTH